MLVESLRLSDATADGPYPVPHVERYRQPVDGGAMEKMRFMTFSLNRIERLASGREGRREGGRKRERGRGREKKRERDGEGAGREVERETKGESIWKNGREMEKKTERMKKIKELMDKQWVEQSSAPVEKKKR